MKKNLTIILLLIIPLVSFSQNNYGIFIGMNRTILSTKILEKDNRELFVSNGFHIGGLYETKLNDNIHFRPKLMISQQGIVKNFMDGIEKKLTYLNLPLNFKFFKKTYIIAGPEIGLMINKKKNENSYIDVNSIDYGFNLGVGREIYNFFIELNLYRGFKTPIDYQIYGNLNNTVFQLSLGYNFE